VLSRLRDCIDDTRRANVDKGSTGTVVLVAFRANMAVRGIDLERGDEIIQMSVSVWGAFELDFFTQLISLLGEGEGYIFSSPEGCVIFKNSF